MAFEEYLEELRKILARYYVDLFFQVPEEKPEFLFEGVAKQHWQVMVPTLTVDKPATLQKNLARFRALYSDNAGFRVSFYESLPRLVERLPFEKNPLIQAVIKLRLESGFSL